MPRKRRIAKLAHRTLRWEDVDIPMQLRFWAAWCPPRNAYEREREPWQDWESYLADWAAVRAAALPDWAAHHAERVAGVRRTVRERREAVAQHPDAPGYLLVLLDGAERSLADVERETTPFAEQLYQAVMLGADPDEWLANRRGEKCPSSRN